ncbi:MAG: DUF1972 domain-containing protein [Paludibacteraceae bacterium]|nr:DUF1972 domain-containing protein [Paludibacteraceae bacterium]
MKQVAIVGCQGIPANYGGFESMVENIVGENASSDVHYTVFCSGVDMPGRLHEYKGCTLKYINVKANGMLSVVYDIFCMMHTFRGYDTVLVLGVSGCMFLPVLKMFSKNRLVVNIDGLEHKRAKWGWFARWILRSSEKLAVKCADVIIADNKGIQDYVSEVYAKPSTLIAYGGDHVIREIEEEKKEKILSDYGLKKQDYAVCVCRIEPENNCHISLEAFSKSDKKIVFIGNWNHSEYSKRLKKQYASYPNIHLLDAIYDLDILYVIRSNASIYVHGHSAGGTNPSLVEAMFFGMPIVAYDCVYNRATTHDKAYYFKDTADLMGLLSNDLDGSSMRSIAEKNYMWKDIALQYEQTY